MKRGMGIMILVLLIWGVYLGWRGYLKERRYEKDYKYTSLLIDSLRSKLDSLKARRKVFKSISKSIISREKERKYEAANLSSIDSLACLANKLLAGKGN
ncbi:MAG: hypothetical protein HF309_15745 [Ignavibacteria bacterium]|jgi:hypothetical protein|nr:hypothetical protein [Ignavibacteria bacterium]